MKKNYQLTIKYDGTNYYGWNPQNNYPTILQTLSKALGQFYLHDAKIYGSGRTDRQVHALGQVASCHLDIAYSRGRLKKLWNNHLPPQIQIIKIKVVANDFHARYSAVSKTYQYQIVKPGLNDVFNCNYYYIYDFTKLNFALIKKGSLFFAQKHNFLSFSSLTIKEQKIKKDFMRQIYDVKIKQSQNKLIFTITGNGFLKHMVRKIIGTLIALGEEKISFDQLQVMINQKDPQSVAFKAPPCGLYLKKVNY